MGLKSQARNAHGPVGVIRFIPSHGGSFAISPNLPLITRIYAYLRPEKKSATRFSAEKAQALRATSRRKSFYIIGRLGRWQARHVTPYASGYKDLRP